MGDIPNTLKNYEQNLRILIKESGTRMEQVTSSIYDVSMSLRKRDNEDIISSKGPRKRTRQSSRKKALKYYVALAIDSILDTAAIGKEVVKMIIELQQQLWVWFLGLSYSGPFSWMLYLVLVFGPIYWFLA